MITHNEEYKKKNAKVAVKSYHTHYVIMYSSFTKNFFSTNGIYVMYSFPIVSDVFTLDYLMSRVILNYTKVYMC